MAKARVLIAGGGIGGLTAGVALVRAGYDVAMFEQAPVLAEVGAGISLSQAAQSGYRWLGLADQIDAASTPTANMAFLHYRTARLLAGAVDHGDGSGSPAGPLAVRQMHRADLHTVLRRAFEEQAPGGLHLGQAVTAVEQVSSDVGLRLADGRLHVGDLIIGADGLRSKIRRSLHGDAPARFTHQVAYRFLVDRADAAPFMQFGRAAMFQGPRRVLNRYTIRHGAVVNCAGISQSDDWQDEGWSIPAHRDEMLAAYKGWHPDVIGLLMRAENAIKWGIFDRPPIPRWSDGAVTLLGDAAHPMLPMLGLGAAMAIEDAVILARALTAENSAPAAFARYEKARVDRTTVVHQQSLRQSDIIQASDPDTFDPKTAPSHDPSYYAYDPVTVAI